MKTKLCESNMVFEWDCGWLHVLQSAVLFNTVGEFGISSRDGGVAIASIYLCEQSVFLCEHEH